MDLSALPEKKSLIGNPDPANNATRPIAKSSNELEITLGIPNNEILFRGVPNDNICFPFDDLTQTRRISENAFNDRNQEPSVDLSSLCDNDPNYTAKMTGPWVISITAEQIRTSSATKTAPGENQEITYYADVKRDPTPESIAHGLIYGKPPFDRGNLFRRIKKSLARKSRWEIGPPE